MSSYNKQSHFQYAIFQILAVHLHFGMFWSGGISIVLRQHHAPLFLLYSLLICQHTHDVFLETIINKKLFYPMDLTLLKLFMKVYVFCFKMSFLYISQVYCYFCIFEIIYPMQFLTGSSKQTDQY